MRVWSLASIWRYGKLLAGQAVCVHYPRTSYRHANGSAVPRRGKGRRMARRPVACGGGHRARAPPLPPGITALRPGGNELVGADSGMRGWAPGTGPPPPGITALRPGPGGMPVLLVVFQKNLVRACASSPEIPRGGHGILPALERMARHRSLERRAARHRSLERRVARHRSLERRMARHRSLSREGGSVPLSREEDGSAPQ
jgi:hypothetical protein